MLILQDVKKMNPEIVSPAEQPKPKFSLLVMAILLVILLVGGFLIFNFFNRKTPPPAPPEATSATQIQPVKSEGGAGQKPNQSSQTLPKTQNPVKPEKK